jgi:hypothetical protein
MIIKGYLCIFSGEERKQDINKVGYKYQPNYIVLTSSVA